VRHRALMGRHGKKALYFDGKDDYVEVSSFSSITSFPFAVEVLLKYDTFLQGWKGIVNWDRDVKKGFWLLTHSYENRLVVGTGDGSTLGEVAIPMDEYSGRWTHIHVNYYEDHFDIYINATHISTKTLDITPALPIGNPLYVARRYYGYFSRGYIALVRMYDGRLFDWLERCGRGVGWFVRRNFIHALNLRATDIREGLVLELIPDTLDCANGVWRDNSGYGNDGTIHGARCIEI